MRSRPVGRRLLAVVLTVLWAVLGVAVLAGYRPGGPLDLLVGVASLTPAAIAAAAIVWPPDHGDERARAAVTWLGIVGILLVAPLLVGVIDALAAGGRQTLLPSLGVGYAGALGLAATSLYTALGVVRERSGGGRPRRRVVRAATLGVAVTVLGGALFGGAAVANEQALLARPATDPVWGPVVPAAEVPTCRERPRLGPGASVSGSGRASVDGEEIASATLEGIRGGRDEAWSASLAGSLGRGRVIWTRIGSDAWLSRGAEPRAVEPDALRLLGEDGLSLDGPIVAVTLGPDGQPIAAEDLGIDLFDGAPARHCRSAIDGQQASDAMVLVRLLATEPLLGSTDSLDRWRGELHWWVFGDGELGRATLLIGGYPGEAWGRSGIQGTIEAELSAVRRDARYAVRPPGP